MTVITGRDATVNSLSRTEMETELGTPLREAGMSEDELRERGAAWELDAHHRGLLARVDGLRFLLAHAAA